MNSAADLLQRGYDAYAAGDFTAADQAYRSVLEAEPANAEALMNLGVVRRHLGDVEESVTLLEQAAQLAPGDFRVFANLGATLQTARRLDDAVAAYRRAYKLEPCTIRQIAVSLAAPGTGTLFLDPDKFEEFLAGE